MPSARRGIVRTRTFSRIRLFRGALALGVLTFCAPATSKAASLATAPAKAPAAVHVPAKTAAAATSSVAAIEVFPPKLELTSIRDSRRLIVTAVDTKGRRRDITAQAQFTEASPHIAIDRDGFVVPNSKGDGEVIVSVLGQTVKVPVHVRDASEPAGRFRAGSRAHPGEGRL